MTDKSAITCPSGEACRFTTELESLKQKVERLSEMVSSDPMTGLFNYRHFNHVLAQEIDRSLRTLQPTTLIMIDVDHFKQVNDHWGHETGNQALQLISQCLLNNIRKLDISCRYGGEEFAIVLPSTDIITGSRVAERIRYSIEQTPLVTTQNSEKHSIPLTVSLGLSMYTGTMEQTASQIVEAADQQLYLAKQQGRNRICFKVPEKSDQQVSNDEKAALFDRYC
ncbi:hypothetical protein AB835_11515 [Candidatus Endobugula sertula]|uniref:diguanylate cyclase n=1 Tax=Candidatus Endobugula sertula TaxID=62101 RepID=A0A1D2QMY2_9GAMM|nr:hypothetical protein AB835_11515 [Candidatus Endobugula sertula]